MSLRCEHDDFVAMPFTSPTAQRTRRRRWSMTGADDTGSAESRCAGGTGAPSNLDTAERFHTGTEASWGHGKTRCWYGK